VAAGDGTRAAAHGVARKPAGAAADQQQEAADQPEVLHELDLLYRPLGPFERPKVMGAQRRDSREQDLPCGLVPVTLSRSLGYFGSQSEVI
jgi:hypothetical protein